jgi:NAD(P)H-dependent FMN reductase
VLQLHVVVASTRPNRVGLPVARWFHAVAARSEHFHAELVDLAEVALPLIDEPNHPRLRKYTKPHTQAWSARVDAADAFVFVTPEYNYSAPPSLINALDYLFHEWGYKPAAFVSYGGVSGGTRSVQMTKQVLTTLKIMPIPEAVTIPFVQQSMDAATGAFKGSEPLEKAAHGMLAELARWAAALKPMRSPPAPAP